PETHRNNRARCTPPTRSHSLPLHDALPICRPRTRGSSRCASKIFSHVLSRLASSTKISSYERGSLSSALATSRASGRMLSSSSKDRKSTRLNSSHVANSYAVFCLKKNIHLQ